MNPLDEWRIEESTRKVGQAAAELVTALKESGAAMESFAATMRAIEWEFQFDDPEAVGASWKFSLN